VASTGKVIAGTGTSVAPGDLAWTDPGNVTVDDISVASCGDLQPPNDSEYLVATNFGLTIPTDATIDGVITYRWLYQDNLAHVILRDLILFKAGSPVGLDQGPNASLILEGGGQAEESRGSASDLWNLSGTLTPAYCNASDFGWGIRVDSIGGVDIEICYCDYMKIEVFYTEEEPPPSTPFFPRYPTMNARW
jgi:hypothetical protein